MHLPTIATFRLLFRYKSQSLKMMSDFEWKQYIRREREVGVWILVKNTNGNVVLQKLV